MNKVKHLSPDHLANLAARLVPFSSPLHSPIAWMIVDLVEQGEATFVLDNGESLVVEPSQFPVATALLVAKERFDYDALIQQLADEKGLVLCDVCERWRKVGAACLGCWLDTLKPIEEIVGAEVKA